MSRETQKVDLDELTGGGSLGSPGGGGEGPTMYRPTPPPTDETQVMKEQKNFKSEMISNRRIYATQPCIIGSPGGGEGPTMYRPTPPPTDETPPFKILIDKMKFGGGQNKRLVNGLRVGRGISRI